MELNSLVGQKALVSQLNRIIANHRVGHAYAFSGASGLGKGTFALAFAKKLLCTSENADPCRCISCRTFEEGTNPDFYEVKTEKQSIGVDAIRDLQVDAANRPSYGNRKVYLIENAELMTVQAQNCLLKTLEEPPEYVVILLTTTSFEALLITIQSRTVNLRMNPYSDEEMKELLHQRVLVPRDELAFILKFSCGNPGNAVHMVEEGTVRELRHLIFTILEKPGDIYAIENVRKALTDNKGEMTTVLDILMSVYRDCLMVLEHMENRLINSDKKDMIIKIASLSSRNKLLDKISLMEKLRRNFKYNLNYQLGIDVLLMEIQEV